MRIAAALPFVALSAVCAQTLPVTGFDCSTSVRDAGSYENCGVGGRRTTLQVPRPSVRSSTGSLVWSGNPIRAGARYTVDVNGTSDLTAVRLSLGASPEFLPDSVTPGAAGTITVSFTAPAVVGPCHHTIFESVLAVRIGDRTLQSSVPVVVSAASTCRSVIALTGDSIGRGMGASDDSHAWFNILSSTVDMPLWNYSMGSHLVADQAEFVFAESVPEDHQIYLLQSGANDVGVYFGDSSKTETLNGMLLAEAAWLSIPERLKLTGRNGRLRYSGDWSPSPYFTFQVQSHFPGPLGRVTSSPGDLAIAAVTGGSVVYVGYTIVDGETGRFRVTVDGEDKGTFYSTGVNQQPIVTRSGRNWAPALARFPGLEDRPHYVVVTALEGNVYLDWIGTNQYSTAERPAVYQISLTPQFGPLSDLIVDYNRAFRQQFALLSDDGLNVHFLDIWGLFDQSDCIADNAHLNDKGQQKYALAVAAAIKP